MVTKNKKKDLGVTTNINGPHRLCLANGVVTFAKIGAKKTSLNLLTFL